MRIYVYKDNMCQDYAAINEFRKIIRIILLYGKVLVEFLVVAKTTHIPKI